MAPEKGLGGRKPGTWNTKGPPMSPTCSEYGVNHSHRSVGAAGPQTTVAVVAKSHTTRLGAGEHGEAELGSLGAGRPLGGPSHQEARRTPVASITAIDFFLL